MQFLFELAPVIAFVIAYVLGGIYVATATIMVAMAVMLAVDYLRTRRIPTMHGLSAVLVFVFGAATLICTINASSSGNLPCSIGS